MAEFSVIERLPLRPYVCDDEAEPELPPVPTCSTIPTIFGPPAHTGPVLYGGDYAFNPDPDGGTNHSHFQILVEEAAVHEDAREIQSFPVWSPDFTKIAYTARDLQWSDVPFPHTAQPVRLVVMNADGSSRRTLYTFTLGAFRNVQTSFTFSPDGSKIAFTAGDGPSYPDDHNTALYVISTDGSGTAQKVSFPYIYGPPIWSHDGAYVMYAKNNPDPPYGTHFMRRKADLSAPAELLLDGGLYGDNATFHQHPYEPIVVFDYYGDDLPETDPSRRVLGFLRVDPPGCPPEFITLGEASWITGDEDYNDQTLGQPMWSPDGRYVLGSQEVDSPLSFREWRWIIIDREQTFLKKIDVFGRPPSEATHVPPDGYELYVGSWKADASGIICWLENDWDIGIAEWNFPNGPLRWLYRGYDTDDYSVNGYIWWRENMTGIPYQGYWSMDANNVN